MKEGIGSNNQIAAPAQDEPKKDAVDKKKKRPRKLRTVRKNKQKKAEDEEEDASEAVYQEMARNISRMVG